jgi:hypothetical protein
MQTVEQMKDELWAEIRQIVLDEGPAAEEIDKNIEETGIDPACREALITQLIANRCAHIASNSHGPFQGMPLPIVLAAWADFTMRQLVEQDADDVADEEVDD